MRGIAALALIAAACVQQQERGEATESNATPAEPASPVLLRFLPPEQGGPSAYPEAIVSGVLDLTGPCVRLQADSDRRMTTVVSSPGPSVGRDFAGLYVETAKERLRHGSSVTGGGGWFDSLPASHGRLDGPVPAACTSGPFVILTGMERYDPADEAPPQPPPPPPGG